ncbi:hypothetical protein LGK97_11510 [Clostridium sp. CS001]|uniref:hypothetical protein n=1 Tax=Clostridium sp. CS001 TaxID=2880648 RepID=UPI001CF56499|nr:hypothetical protein [Clostridium sp. CS001]MCB2290393.1 hypothetical protein [Clostridium sp. CS001]
MKFNKKSKIIISLALGTVMFTTTAIAQVISKSGYDQLKDSVKYTAEACTTNLSSYTVDMSIDVKDNGAVICSQNDITKFDVSNQTKESVTTTIEGGTKKEGYWYSDKNSYISKNSGDDVYYNTQYESPRETVVPSNPFKEKGATDMEKIADAIVGSLKDAVVVTENKDGSKILSGKLSEFQIPALINAVVSLQSKNEFGNDYNNESVMPKITKDVFVKEITGNMVTTKEGLIESVLGSGVLVGTEESGKEHSLSFEILVKITNVNLTKINKPDLTGKKVEKNIEKDHSTISSPEKFIGKYKSDMIIEKNGKFEKIGESFVDITTIDGKSVSGRHYEEYVKGYEEYATNKKDFKFNAKFEQDQFNGQFTSDSASKDIVKGHISIDQYSAKVYFNVDRNRSSNIMLDGQYNKVFN